MLCLICRYTYQSEIGCCDDCWQTLASPSINTSSSLYINTLYAGFLYEDPIRQFIVDLKFHEHWQLGHWLGQWLLKKMPNRSEQPQALLPVPLHQSRLQERGYNQAIEIAKPLSKAWKVPLLRQSVTRVKNTKPQSELKKEARTLNVRRAFQATEVIPYKHIALVDDVTTTGATLNAIAQVLLESGVTRVDAYTVAKV